MSRLFHKTSIQTEIVSDGVHPTLSRTSVIWITFHDGLIEFLERQFPARAADDGTSNENHIRIPRLKSTFRQSGKETC